MKPDSCQRVLLVEDDPTSRAFLADVLAQVARVDAVGSGGAAMQQVAEGVAFDLWLIDAHLPDTDGPSLLGALRRQAPYTPALAHTADPDPALAARLRDAGFVEVLTKPVPMAALLAATTRALQGATSVAETPPPAWDPDRALAAVRGRHADAGLLRRMFLAELPAQRDALASAFAAHDTAAMSAILHRLRASCALVGATALAVAVRDLEAHPRSPSAWRAFVFAVAGVAGLEDAAEVGQQVP